MVRRLYHLVLSAILAVAAYISHWEFVRRSCTDGVQMKDKWLTPQWLMASHR
jgi:hypothetical protein